MQDNDNPATPAGVIAVISYVLILFSFLYCGFRGFPLKKDTTPFLWACLVSLALLMLFADTLTRWTRTGRAMSVALAVGASTLLATVAYLHLH
jgi:hypothetical protein